MRTMPSVRLSPVDAQFLWLSEKIPNDQLLVFVFDGKPDIPVGLEQVRRNATACDDLRLRVCDDTRWRYPKWVTGEIGDGQFSVNPGPFDWSDCLDALSRLAPLDVSRIAWRFHVFPPNVAVVQMSHALADGARSATLAATMFGRRGNLPPVSADHGNLLWRSVIAACDHRRLLRDIEAGLVPPPSPPRPALSVNARSAVPPVRHTFILDRRRLETPTVTVAALSLIGEALGGYLADRGEDISRLGAEVPMAFGWSGYARNNFRNVNIGLHPELDRDRRTARIRADLTAQRRRVEHPAARAEAAAFAAVPAPLLRWGIGQVDPDARPRAVAGHTVVSSVNRGPADLTFGGRPVVLTAGFPALSPMMGLTHGVHGIGDRVALSVHADPGVIDVGDYLDRLARLATPGQTAAWQGKCE